MNSFTDEEIEYAGNKNIAWNVNLILFLYRNKLIDVIDVISWPTKGSYFVKVKLLDIDILTHKQQLSHAFLLRENEFKKQVERFYLIKELFKNQNRFVGGKICPIISSCFGKNVTVVQRMKKQFMKRIMVYSHS